MKRSLYPDFSRESHRIRQYGPSCLRLTHETKSLWEFVERRLLFIATDSKYSVEVILNLMQDFIVETRLVSKYDLNLNVLVDFIREVNVPEFLHTCAQIAKWALEVKRLFPESIKILKQGKRDTVSLSLQQVRCLLSLMFFCCLPKQDKAHNLPSDYTFVRLYNGEHGNNVQISKLKCIYNYFRHAGEINTSHNISFTRNILFEEVDWRSNHLPMSNVQVETDSSSTEDFRDKIMIDFANAYLGGGVLGRGSVQEEIMLIRHVEPLVGLLFTERMADQEAIVIVGARLYNRTRGYNANFTWTGPYRERVSLDHRNRAETCIVAIDAVDYSGRRNLQYSNRQILREITKAYVGFRGDENQNQNRLRGVATGRWGCGVFNGDDQLKFLIQWIAASICRREMIFLPRNMKDIRLLRRFIQVYKEKTVEEVVSQMLAFGENLRQGVFELLLNCSRNESQFYSSARTGDLHGRYPHTHNQFY